MPANNNKHTKGEKANVALPKVERTPEVIVRKTVNEAIIDGFKDPSQFARDFLDIDPYEEQVKFLRNSRDCSEANFVAGNRVGKSWLGGVVLLWRAFYRFISPYTAPERASPHVTYTAVSTSLTEDQAKLCWNYAYTFANNSPRFKPFIANVVHSPFATMVINTRNERGERVNSEIWARSLAKGGVYLLGHSLSLVLVDEAAYVSNYPQIEDEVLRMRLADQGGALFRISTPNGRNFFFNYYQSGLTGDPRYYSHRITTWDNPYISRAFVEEQKERMLPEFYQQNVMAEFVSLSDFFNIKVIEALYRDQDYSLPVEPVKNATYVMGVDLGAQRDPTVVIVWRVYPDKSAEIVYCGEIRNTNWRAARQFVANVYGTYLPAKTYVDSTGVGAPIAQQLIDEDGFQNTVPFVITASSKPEMMVKLQDAAQRRKFVYPYVENTKELTAQLGFYRLDDKKISQDYPLALALTNLAYEDFSTQRGMQTEIYADLGMFELGAGGRYISGFDDDELENGTLFDYDPRSGLFVPR